MLSVFAKSHKVCGEVFFLVGGARFNSHASRVDHAFHNLPHSYNSKYSTTTGFYKTITGSKKCGHTKCRVTL